MALARNLVVGETYTIRAGRLTGQEVKIVNATPVPDGQRNQRKVRVRIGGKLAYVLPREIEDGLPPQRGARSPRTQLLSAPVTAKALQELVKLAKRDDLEIRLAILGNFTDDEIERIRSVVED